MTRKIEKVEPYNPSKTCASCSHMHGDCEMYHKPGVMIAFNHRLVRCNWFEKTTVEDSAEPEFDGRGPDRNEWRHEAAKAMRLK